MKLHKILISICMLLGLLSFCGFQTEPMKSASTQHEFSATIHYQYQLRRYDPVVPIVYIDNKPKSNSIPEEALVSLLSALHKGNYEWWLDTWDDNSRKELLHRQQGSGQPLNLWFKSVVSTNVFDKCILTKWIHRRQYVILRYACLDATVPQVTNHELATAFKRARGEWVATLDLESDPIFKHADGTNVELDLRPRD